MAATTGAVTKRRPAVRKPAGPKSVYLIYGSDPSTGKIAVHALTTNAEDAMLALSANPGADFHRGELPVARRAAGAPEAGSDGSAT